MIAHDVAMRHREAVFVLSGLVSTDVPQVGLRYASLLRDQRAEVYERGEWRALVWRRVCATLPA